jgi:hypothetical protein
VTYALSRELSMKMRKVYEDDCLMTREEFMNGVESNALIDYDGFGEFATETEVYDVEVSPSAVRSTKWPDWATHVCWYNK